eukprot:scaffold452436_cov37-Prasinocladus_malaysianus.AAC.1
MDMTTAATSIAQTRNQSCKKNIIQRRNFYGPPVPVLLTDSLETRSSQKVDRLSGRTVLPITLTLTLASCPLTVGGAPRLPTLAIQVGSRDAGPMGATGRGGRSDELAPGRTPAKAWARACWWTSRASDVLLSSYPPSSRLCLSDYKY